MKIPKFIIGLILGASIGLVIWYWQKSTSAEEGALAVLDRLAAAEARVRDLEARLRLAKGKENGAKSEHSTTVAGMGEIAMEGAGTEKVEDDTKPSIQQSNEPRTDDLQVINGIGPTFAKRLGDAGIFTFADLAQQSPDRLREITGLKTWHSADPQAWIDEAGNYL